MQSRKCNARIRWKAPTVRAVRGRWRARSGVRALPSSVRSSDALARFVCLPRASANQGRSRAASSYVARFGVPPVGMRLLIRTRQQTGGWEDLPEQTAAIVPAA